LLSNAKYAVEERQRLSKSDVYTKIITIKSYGINGQVVFEIEDNGTGIPKKYINNIFDPFFTTKDVEYGTGLGLSITYGIIKEMKGDISVNSKINEFTIIKVSLPKN
jgi:signal transduction histidine kinase